MDEGEEGGPRYDNDYYDSRQRSRSSHYDHYNDRYGPQRPSYNTYPPPHMWGMPPPMMAAMGGMPGMPGVLNAMQPMQQMTTQTMGGVVAPSSVQLTLQPAMPPASAVLGVGDIETQVSNLKV